MDGIAFTVEDGIGRITLDRPEAGNAITLPLARALLTRWVDEAPIPPPAPRPEGTRKRARVVPPAARPRSGLNPLRDHGEPGLLQRSNAVRPANQFGREYEVASEVGPGSKERSAVALGASAAVRNASRQALAPSLVEKRRVGAALAARPATAHPTRRGRQ